MSESQSGFFFPMLEHAIVPVRATEFAEVETGLNRAFRGKHSAILNGYTSGIAPTDVINTPLVG